MKAAAGIAMFSVALLPVQGIRMRFRLVVPAVVLAALPDAGAQQQAYTGADYARAERFMNYNTTPLVFGNGRSANLDAR